MIFDVLTLFPEMVEGCCDFSILKRAVDKSILSLNPKADEIRFDTLSTVISGK